MFKVKDNIIIYEYITFCKKKNCCTTCIIFYVIIAGYLKTIYFIFVISRFLFLFPSFLDFV